MDKLLDVEKLFRVEDASELSDWNIPLSFMKSRHLEVIEGLEDEGTSWRIKDRVGRLLRKKGGREGSVSSTGPFAVCVYACVCVSVCLYVCIRVYVRVYVCGCGCGCGYVGGCVGVAVTRHTLVYHFLCWLQMRTVNVVLSLCLNLGVDPPDVVKTDPCARLECWIGGRALGGGRVG